uniref:Uncharacterized protein n=1 Tax=Oryza sativa subsp. japonica TaxID=39947 RepID=Q6Z960_ORYSJ|nr:hypothetical protein [Oryza sativa Japonica Group]
MGINMYTRGHCNESLNQYNYSRRIATSLPRFLLIIRQNLAPGAGLHRFSSISGEGGQTDWHARISSTFGPALELSRSPRPGGRPPSSAPRRRETARRPPCATVGRPPADRPPLSPSTWPLAVLCAPPKGGHPPTSTLHRGEAARRPAAPEPLNAAAHNPPRAAVGRPPTDLRAPPWGGRPTTGHSLSPSTRTLAVLRAPPWGGRQPSSAHHLPTGRPP